MNYLIGALLALGVVALIAWMMRAGTIDVYDEAQVAAASKPPTPPLHDRMEYGTAGTMGYYSDGKNWREMMNGKEVPAGTLAASGFPPPPWPNPK